MSDTTSGRDAIIADGGAQGPAIVKIAAGDKAFQSTDCKPWKKTGQPSASRAPAPAAAVSGGRWPG
ncbi:hypothetical protein OHT57_01390 [Streptomyces sp. NBC_00285]|uniref:hypothetical protein n=1 Tax=Streptomyces sp. NBC_00285 TaxID=2975700 RepID=UPI002E2C5876|nr:hypothetical protein [Streptomyces sp. NBC_00285]